MPNVPGANLCKSVTAFQSLLQAQAARTPPLCFPRAHLQALEDSGAQCPPDGGCLQSFKRIKSVAVAYILVFNSFSTSWGVQ